MNQAYLPLQYALNTALWIAENVLDESQARQLVSEINRVVTRFVPGIEEYSLGSMEATSTSTTQTTTGVAGTARQ